MVETILLEIARTFPGLTPEVVWKEKTHAQMLIYYRAAKRQQNEQSAQQAVVSRMAVATAIINTIAGKDVPEFDRMIQGLLGDEGPEKEQAAPVDIAGFGIVPGPTSGPEGFKEL